MRIRLRQKHEASENAVAGLSVILELEVHIAAEARIARRELATSGVGHPKSVRYIGTLLGLAGLIADIKAAGVADGVAITPIVDAHRAAVARRVVDEVMPLLPAGVVGSRPAAGVRRLTA